MYVPKSARARAEARPFALETSAKRKCSELKSSIVSIPQKNIFQVLYVFKL